MRPSGEGKCDKAKDQDDAFDVDRFAVELVEHGRERGSIPAAAAIPTVPPTEACAVSMRGMMENCE